ncbi:hypothetical protein P3W85_00500 [Cupriavidus basilensis]|uniref:Uncharacterized protein n=1 Tax=Cupriavidus basilensis TaxID=68895 RepID=A0ABT6AGA8_9BURK|nr:hypothetical protein [Cupriavidus basilensis]MDF3831448.1 hypothetical protein [Cupriavidus basilensis]
MRDSNAYRAFRKRVLAKIEDECPIRGRRRFDADEDKLRPFGMGRRAIAAFRGDVADHAEALLRESPELESVIRRALSIPPSLALLPTRAAIVGQVALFVLPDAMRLHRARRLLRRVRTFEGRAHIFRHFIERTLPPGFDYYSEELDFALLRFDPAQSTRELGNLQYFDLDVLKAGFCLGLRVPNAVMEAFPRTPGRPPGGLLRALVEEGAIRHVAELSWTGRKVRAREFYAVRPQPSELLDARATIRCLLAYDIDRELVAGVSRFYLETLAPDRLAANLALLQGAGVTDLSRVFAQVGESLWRTPTEGWRFILETIGARSAGDIGRFKPLLESHRNVSAELVRGLLALGADLDGVASCQQLLLSVADERDQGAPPVDALKLLVSPPHALGIEQIAQCAVYLTGKRDLAAFLRVLADHGYGGADAVLAFLACYVSVSAPTLNRLLAILGERGRAEPLPLVATWVQQAGQGGYLDAFEYLVSAVDMPGMPALQQALRLVSLGVPFLRYLVEDRSLGSLKAIRDWYYHDAKGIDGYRSWGAFDAVDKVLLDDAYIRREFSRLHGNQRCIAGAVSDRVVARIGRWPFQADEATQSAYRRASEMAERQERAAMLPALSVILGRTGGGLLPSLFEGGWEGEHDLEIRLARLTPLLADLLDGRGPTGSSLSPFEVDAIALIYRTTADTVTSQWPGVVGRERDVDGLKLRSHYPMSWTQARWQIQRPLDRNGFFTLCRAAKFAGRFAPSCFHDMFTACQHLSPKQLSEPSADIGSLALHLGSLLAIAREDDVAAQWIREGFEALTLIDEESLIAYQRMGELIALFDVVLPDALDAHLERFVQRFDDDEAVHWASRLEQISHRAEAEDGRARLRSSLMRVRDKVLPIYLAWARRQWRKFGKASSAGHETTALKAVVSKHPAAFFAKSAVSLCTAANVDMWREARQSHLLVFDPEGQRLAGMALLYVEVVPAIDPIRPSLVIRALNPTDEMLAGHAADSIVASFFAVAVQIAEANGLASVAFPAPTGMHLMSNRRAIEEHIQSRYIKRATPAWSRQSESATEVRSLHEAPQRVEASFDAYERGKERVDTLYVVWRADLVERLDETEERTMTV